MTRNELFIKQDQLYRDLSYADIIDKALFDARAFVKCCQENGILDRDIILYVVLSARIGTGNRTELNFYEKKIIDKVMGLSIMNQNQIINMVYPEVAKKVTEADYAILQRMKLSPKITALFLSLILDFAYIDGTVDERVMDRIDEILFDNTDKNNESDDIQIKKRIVKIIKSSKKPMTPRKIAEEINIPPTEVKELLNTLCAEHKVKKIYLDINHIMPAYVIDDSV